jgi:formate dehydrogenase maturation protein FdhE
MQVLEAAVAANPWPLRRERAAELAERYPHAAEMLRLYQALTAVQEAAYRTSPENIAAFAAEHVLPGVIDVTVEAGPRPLRDGVVALFASEDMEDLIQRWLDQQPLKPFETYLARASASPLLEAVTPHPDPPPQGGREFETEGSRTRCPTCGGLPQLSYFAVTGEALVSGPRYLVCSRCATNWIFSRMTCASCGESNGTKLPIYQEQEQFPHARVDGCQTCRKYLLTFDLRRDTRAVPIVDEIAALPLDLYARDQGLTKITPNLMGN